MVNLLEDCNLEEQRSLISFFVAECVKSSEILSRTLLQYVKSLSFYKWPNKYERRTPKWLGFSDNDFYKTIKLLST